MVSKWDYKKIVAIPVFNNDGYILSEYLEIKIKSTTEEIYIHCHLRFRNIYIKHTNFDVYHNKSDYEIRNDIKKLIDKNPFISFEAIRRKTGLSSCAISRHYMSLKRNRSNDFQM